MAIVDGYCSLTNLKNRLSLDGSTPELDPILEGVIEAASRMIDGVTGRVFYQRTAQARVFSAEESWMLDIDDLVSVTTLKADEDGDRVYEITWAITDYDLGPLNAAIYGRPYTRITLTPNSTRSFPTLSRSVQITGTWGWPAVPDAVEEACLITAHRYYTRKNAPYGVTGSLELGQQSLVIPSMDPDVKALLAPFKRLGLVAV